MEILELFDIAERDIELANPCSPEKIAQVGAELGLQPGERVIEFGSGYAEVLAIWAERFGVSGVGVEVRPRAHERALRRIAARGLADRIALHLGDGAGFAFEERSHDVAACIGACFIWGDFERTVRALRRAIRPGGRLAIGEPYWRNPEVPAAYAPQSVPYHFLTEPEILATSRAEGFEIAAVIRGSRDDWDRYMTGNWRGLLAWLAENPDHPEREQVSAFLHRMQDDYFTYERPFIGWAVYVLRQTAAADA